MDMKSAWKNVSLSYTFYRPGIKSRDTDQPRPRMRLMSSLTDLEKKARTEGTSKNDLDFLRRDFLKLNGHADKTLECSHAVSIIVFHLECCGFDSAQ